MQEIAQNQFNLSEIETHNPASIPESQLRELENQVQQELKEKYNRGL